MADTKVTKLPKDFWDTVEAYLPRYYSRDDVALNDDMQKYVDGEADETTIARVEKALGGHPLRGAQAMLLVRTLLRESNIRLYNEALEAKGTVSND